MLNRLQICSARRSKASRTARLIALECGGRARWTPRDYAALAREGYQTNAIVHRAVRLIAEASARCLSCSMRARPSTTAHPLLDLLARPNPRQDGASLLGSIDAHLLLAGNAYVEAVGLDGGRGRGCNVRELYALRPDRMKVVPGPDGWPQGLRIHRQRRRPCASTRARRCRRSCISPCSIRSTTITA